MELCHTNSLLQSPAAQHLAEYIQQRGEHWAEDTKVARLESFEQFEREVHELVMALEREMVGEELSRYDITAEEIEVEGTVYSCGISLPETYLTAAGRVSVERHRYYPVADQGPSICPLEMQSGIIGGYFTPRAARQAAFAMAHLTPGESEAVFGEIGNMQSSRSSLDRLTKELSPRWERQRAVWEAQVRQADSVPPEAHIVAISVDGVTGGGQGRESRSTGQACQWPNRLQGGRLRNGDLIRPGDRTPAHHPLCAHAREQESDLTTTTGHRSGRYPGGTP